VRAVIDENPQQKSFVGAVDILKVELSLFWQRSIFFWGFIAASFIGYGVLIRDHKELALAISCFGLTCSLAWTLINRASKRWHENWLYKVQQMERVVFGSDTFSRLDEPDSPSTWWGGWRYSVTKLTIALSDFAVLIWIALVYKAAIASTLDLYSAAILVVTVLYLLAILFGCRSKRRIQGKE